METNNKLIAEFLGYIDNGCSEEGFLIDPKTNYDICIDNLQFHSDLNWLMEVVEKIESLGYKVDISKWENSQYCGIYLNGKKISGNETNTKIEAVYNVCLEFIKWYNENKN